MDPVTFGFGLKGAGAFLSALQGDPMERYRKLGLQMLRDEYDTDAFDPNIVAKNRFLSTVPRLRQLGRAAERRFGLNSGEAFRNLAQWSAADQSGAYGDAYVQNAIDRKNRRLAIGQTYASM